MSENRNYLMADVPDQPQRSWSWQRWRELAAALAIGIFGTSAALAIDNLPPQAPNQAPPGPTCQWPALQGGLMTPPVFVLAFDKDFNIQGFFRPGGPGMPKDPPPSGTPDQTVFLEKHGSATTYCYTIDGKRKCIEE